MLTVDDYFQILIKNDKIWREVIKARVCKYLGNQEYKDLYSDSTLLMAENILEGKLRFEGERQVYNYLEKVVWSRNRSAHKAAQQRHKRDEEWTRFTTSDEPSHDHDTLEFEERYERMVEYIQGAYPPMFEGIFKLSVIGKVIDTKGKVKRKAYTYTEMGKMYGKSKQQVYDMMRVLKLDLAKQFAPIATDLQNEWE